MFEFLNADEHRFYFKVKYCTMDLLKLQIESFDQLNAPSQQPRKVKKKSHSMAEINKALALLGFNSWTSVEPSKSFNY